MCECNCNETVNVPTGPIGPQGIQGPPGPASLPIIGLNEIAYGDSITGQITSNSLFMRNPSNGNIGLGLNTPTAKMHITSNGDISSGYALKINSNSGNELFYVRDDGYIQAGEVYGSMSIGIGCGFVPASGQVNTFIGYYVAQNAGLASANTGIGYNAMWSLTDGLDNTAVGFKSLYGTTTGSHNTAFGVYALRENTTANFNSAFGKEALKFNTTGDSNSSFGTVSLFSNTTGSLNSAFGSAALNQNTTGSGNTSFGRESLYLNTIGSDNTAIGYHSMFLNSTGIQNTAIGTASGYNSTGSNNVFLGFQSGFYTTSSNQLRIDNQARANAADELLKSLITGTFSAAVSNQSLGFNAQKINMSYLPTSNIGLSTGDLYIDSAANILANGDKVVGWKI